jgi:hypothetical protein
MTNAVNTTITGASGSVEISKLEVECLVRYVNVSLAVNVGIHHPGG